METTCGVLLHRDMWRRDGDGVWPLRNVAADCDDVDTRRLDGNGPSLYGQSAWDARLVRFVTLVSGSGHRHNGYLCSLRRRQP